MTKTESQPQLMYIATPMYIFYSENSYEAMLVSTAMVNQDLDVLRHLGGCILPPSHLEVAQTQKTLAMPFRSISMGHQFLTCGACQTLVARCCDLVKGI